MLVPTFFFSQLLSTGSASASAATRDVRVILLELLLLTKQASTSAAGLDHLVYRLLALVLRHLQSTSDGEVDVLATNAVEVVGADDVGVLQLPPLLATALDVLTLRSSGAVAALLPAIDLHLKAATGAAFDTVPKNTPALQAVARLLLACEPLRRSDLPGSTALRRTVDGVIHRSKAALAAIDQPPAERGAAAKAVTTEAVAAANADMSLLLAPYQALVKAM